MTDPLDPRDAAFIESVRESYAPEPLSPSGRVAFDAALRSRTERRPRPPWLVPGLAAAAVLAAALLWLPEVWRTERPGPETLVAETAAPVPEVEAAWVEWEESVFFPQLEPDAFRGADALPDDYLAISGLLLESS